MLSTILADTWRILTFRKPSPQIALHWRAYLAFGILATWLAGIGRYWDNPKAHLVQHLGLGSVAYVLFLASLLWLLIAPLRPARWSWKQVLVFVTLCSPPALLYAIPVERFMSMPAAQATNAWFLAAIASWRVALLVVFLRRVAGLSAVETWVGTMLPLTLIVFTLSALNLEHVVFSIMAGIAPEDHSSADLSYSIVFALAVLSIIAAPVMVLWYGCLIYMARWKIR